MVSLYIIYTRKFWKKESYVWDQFWEIDSRAVENLTAKNWLKSEAAIRGVLYKKVFLEISQNS